MLTFLKKKAPWNCYRSQEYIYVYFDHASLNQRPSVGKFQRNSIPWVGFFHQELVIPGETPGFLVNQLGIPQKFHPCDRLLIQDLVIPVRRRNILIDTAEAPTLLYNFANSKPYAKRGPVEIV
jgi:hypothetical protein